MKVYIWQNNRGSKWYIHYDYDHPLDKQLRGTTEDLFSRTLLTCESVDKKATFRMNPRTGCGELFTDMSFYQFLLQEDTRQDHKEKCILHSTGRWLVQHPKLEGVQMI